MVIDLKTLYGAEATEQQKRYEELSAYFAEEFGDANALSYFSAPGRTEVGGNHTDHNNGKVLRTVNILRLKYNKLTGVQSVLEDDGIAEDEFLDSVNFLTEEGYIHLRRISNKEPAALADTDYTALEAKLTGKGIRLLAGGIEDDMIEV